MKTANTQVLMCSLLFGFMGVGRLQASTPTVGASAREHLATVPNKPPYTGKERRVAIYTTTVLQPHYQPPRGARLLLLPSVGLEDSDLMLLAYTVDGKEVVISVSKQFFSLSLEDPMVAGREGEGVGTIQRVANEALVDVADMAFQGTTQKGEALRSFPRDSANTWAIMSSRFYFTWSRSDGRLLFLFVPNPLRPPAVSPQRILECTLKQCHNWFLGNDSMVRLPGEPPDAPRTPEQEEHECEVIANGVRPWPVSAQGPAAKRLAAELSAKGLSRLSIGYRPPQGLLPVFVPEQRSGGAAMVRMRYDRAEEILCLTRTAKEFVVQVDNPLPAVAPPKPTGYELPPPRAITDADVEALAARLFADAADAKAQATEATADRAAGTLKSKNAWLNGAKWVQTREYILFYINDPSKP